MAADDAAVVVTLRANLKDYEAALKSAVRSTEQAAGNAEKALSGVGKQAAGDARGLQSELNAAFSGVTSGNAVESIENLSGAAKELIQEFAGGGLQGAASSLSIAVAGVFNPVNLAVVAFGLLASAATTYFLESEEGSEKATKEMEEHLAALRKLADAYKAMLPDLDAYVTRQEKAAAAAKLVQTALAEQAAQQEKINQAFKSIDAGDALNELFIQIQQNAGAAAETMQSELLAALARFQQAQAEGKGVQEAWNKLVATATDLEKQFGDGSTATADALKKLGDALATNIKILEDTTKASEIVTVNLKDVTAALQALIGVDPTGLLAIIDMLGQQFPDALGAASGALSSLGNLVGDIWTDAGKSISSATDLIKHFEAFITHAKWDVNAFRVGFGSDTFVDEMGRVQKVTKDTVVTLQQANSDLARRIGEFQGTIVRQIGPDVWTNLLESQKAALTSLAYNYGSLPDSIVAALKKGDMGKVATAIANLSANPDRRRQEAELFARGSFPAEQSLKTADATRKANEKLQEYLRSLDEQASLQVRINEINTTSTLNADQKRIAIEVETELQKALNQARQDGITLTDADIAKIREKAAANAMAGNAAIAISEAEKAAAKEAAAAAAAAKKEAKDQAQALQNLAKTLAGMATGALTGFVQDLRNGTDAAEALYNAVSRIADQLLQMALNMMFQKLFGSLLGAAGGGLGGGLFASGGYTGDRSTRAPAGIVHGQEFVINAQATRKHRDLLEAINKGVPGYASGGFVLPRMTGGQMMQSAQQAAPQVTARTSVINMFDASSFLSEALSKPSGANVVLNLIRSQPAAFRQAIQG